MLSARRGKHASFSPHVAQAQSCTSQVAELTRTGIYRILICQPSHSLGNSLLLTPLLCELRRIYPGAEVDILTRCRVAREIYSGHCNLRHIWCLPAHAAGHLVACARTLRRVRAVRYDLGIDPDAKSRSGRLLLGIAHARHTLGFVGDKKRRGVTCGVPVPRQLQCKGKLPVYLLREAIGDHDEAEFPAPDICLSDAERKRGRRILRDVIGHDDARRSRKVIGIFANATGPKLLADTWWTAFIAELETLRADHTIVEIVPGYARSALGDQYPAYFSSDLRKLGSVLGTLDHFISLDCGVMHLGSASRAKTIAIFTTTRSDQWGPYGHDECIVEAATLTPGATAREVMRHVRRTS